VNRAFFVEDMWRKLVIGGFYGLWYGCRALLWKDRARGVNMWGSFRGGYAAQSAHQLTLWALL